MKGTASSRDRTWFACCPEGKGEVGGLAVSEPNWSRSFSPEVRLYQSLADYRTKIYRHAADYRMKICRCPVDYWAKMVAGLDFSGIKLVYGTDSGLFLTGRGALCRGENGREMEARPRLRSGLLAWPSCGGGVESNTLGLGKQSLARRYRTLVPASLSQPCPMAVLHLSPALII